MKRKELDSLRAQYPSQRSETLFKLFAPQPTRGYFDLWSLLNALIRPFRVLATMPRLC